MAAKGFLELCQGSSSDNEELLRGLIAPQQPRAFWNSPGAQDLTLFKSFASLQPPLHSQGSLWFLLPLCLSVILELLSDCWVCLGPEACLVVSVVHSTCSKDYKWLPNPLHVALLESGVQHQGEMSKRSPGLLWTAARDGRAASKPCADTVMDGLGSPPSHSENLRDILQGS